MPNITIPRGSVVDRVVELRDIFPTMLSVAGALSVDGTTLVKLSNFIRRIVHEFAYCNASLILQGCQLQVLGPKSEP